MSDISSIDSDISNSEQELLLMLDTFMKGRKPHPKYALPQQQPVIIADDAATNPSSALSTSFSSLAIQSSSKDIPNDLKTRSKKAVDEPIRLLSSDMVRYLKKHEFKVRGTTGKTYTVKIGSRLECNCRDHQIRKGHCKHILFILIKELKIQDLSAPIFSTLFPSDEVLKDAFINYHPMP